MVMLQTEVNENYQPAIPQSVLQQIPQFVPAQSEAVSSQDVPDSSKDVSDLCQDKQKSPGADVGENKQEQSKKKKQIAKIKSIKKWKNCISIYLSNMILHQIIVHIMFVY